MSTVADTLRGYGQWLRVAMARPVRGATLREKHLLLLASHLPPDVTGGVYRPLSFLRYGSRLGWRMSAISEPLAGPPTAAGEYLAGLLPDGVAIHRFQPSDISPSWRLFPRVDGGFPDALAVAAFAKQRFANDPPAIVMASGPSFNMFVAACYAAKALGAGLALDYRDEWSESPFDFVEKGNSDRYFEARCLERADVVFFTTESQRTHQARMFPRLDPLKCHVVANGWEPGDVPAASGPAGIGGAENSDVITLSFVGTLGSHTSPGPFLDALAAMLERRPDLQRRVKIRFVGRQAPGMPARLESFRFRHLLDLRSEVPKPEALRAMSESDYLLVFAGRDLARYMPGKLYDYVAAGRPILVFGHPGEAQEAVLRLGAGLFVAEGDVAGLEDALSRVDEIAEARRDAQPRIDAWLAQHTRQALASKALTILEGALKRSG